MSALESLNNYTRTVNSDLTPTRRMLSSLQEEGINTDELLPFFKGKGNQLAVSCAGSGKTTGLVLKVLWDVLSGEMTKLFDNGEQVFRVLDSIWVATFLSSGARDIARSMGTWQHKLRTVDVASNIKISTLHAEFRSVLVDAGLECNVISEVQNRALLRKVLKAKGIHTNSETFNNLVSDLDYTRNRIDSARYDRDTYGELGLTPTTIDDIISSWMTLRTYNGKLDFTDMQTILYQRACVDKDPQWVETLRNRYSYIFQDEFQDISQVQYEILKVYASGAKKIIAIGDDDQTIYTWRGSDSRIILERFPEDFNPTKVQFSVNYRVPSKIVNAIIPSINNNENRYAKPIKAYAEGGQLNVGYFGSKIDMANMLTDSILFDYEQGMSVAVLVRVNREALAPAMLHLVRSPEVPFGMSSKEMTLSNSIGKSVMAIPSLLYEKGGPKVVEALRSMVYQKREAHLVAEEALSRGSTVLDIVDSDMSYSCPKIYGHLKNIKSFLTGNTQEDLNNLFEYYRSVVYYKPSHYNDTCRTVIQSVQSLLSVVQPDTPQQAYYELNDISESLISHTSVLNARINFATVHEFKGREADSVYVWNDSNGIYPYQHNSLEEMDIEEERRLHYIACTRSRKKLTILSTNNPSVFLKEMDLTEANIRAIHQKEVQL